MRRYSIFDEIQRMHEDMDRMFDGWFGNTSATPLLGTTKNYLAPRRAAADVYETDKEFVAEIDLPGVDKKNIHLDVTDNAINVSCEQKHESEITDEKKGIYRMERSSSGFYRQIPLPQNVDTNNVDAKYENGVLKISVPKKQLEDKSKKRIEIK